MDHKDIGVIVGRFQVPKLHDAHQKLINSVRNMHKKTIVFLGTTTVVTRRNPLDFASRKAMFEAAYSDLVILPIPDMPSDTAWSQELDRRIREVFNTGSVLLYGGRDSFIPHYTGIFEVKELQQDHYVSGVEVRDEYKHLVHKSEHFRAGVVYAIYNQYPKVYPTVDVAVLRQEEGRWQCLLAKKPNEHGFRFIGGFVDPTDTCYEQAARREVREESGVEIGNVEYVCSEQVIDWRYVQETDKITTTLFKAPYVFGVIQPMDDISELRWVDCIVESVTLGGEDGPRLNTTMGGVRIEPVHQSLVRRLCQHLGNLQQTKELGDEAENIVSNRRL